jgi:hypothetical protein
LRSIHDQEAFQVYIQVPQEIGVLFPKVAAKIVFTLKRVTIYSPAVFATIYRTSVALRRLVNIIDMAAEVFGIFKCWYITVVALVRLVPSSGDA